MAQPPRGFNSWRDAHQHRMNSNNDSDLAEAIRLSAVNYRQEQMARYQQGIEIAVQLLPISAAPESIINQYSDMLHESYAGSDYILLPGHFANTIYPDVSTQRFSTGLTVFKTRRNNNDHTVPTNIQILQGDNDEENKKCDNLHSHHTIPEHVYLTMRGFIEGPDQEFAYVDNTMFDYLDTGFGQVLHLTIVPSNHLCPGSRVILRPLQPLQFLGVTDQAQLVEGHLGREYRILYNGQHISFYSDDQILDMIVDELYTDYPINSNNSDEPVSDDQPVIITDTNLEVEFRVSDEDMATFAAMQRPPPPSISKSRTQKKRIRIRGILPAHLEKIADEIESRCCSTNVDLHSTSGKTSGNTSWASQGFKLKHKIST